MPSKTKQTTTAAKETQPKKAAARNAPAKKASTTAAMSTASKKAHQAEGASAKKASAGKGASGKKVNPALMKPLQPSKELAAVVGSEPVREKIEAQETLVILWPALLLRRCWCARLALIGPAIKAVKPRRIVSAS